MSIESVMGPVHFGEARRDGAGAAVVFVAVGVISIELYCARPGVAQIGGPRPGSAIAVSPTLILASHARLLRSRVACAPGSHVYLRRARRPAAAPRRARHCALSQRKADRRGHSVCANAPADFEARYLEAVLDEEPLLSDHLLDLAEWISQYYLAPLGEVLRGMLPLMAEVRRPSTTALPTSDVTCWREPRWRLGESEVVSEEETSGAKALDDWVNFRHD